MKPAVAVLFVVSLAWGISPRVPACAEPVPRACEPGRFDVSIGVGPAGVTSGFADAAFWYGVAEYGVSDQLSAGGFVGRVSRSAPTSHGTRTLDYVMYGVRGSYHLADLAPDGRLDLYAGGSLGRQATTLEEAQLEVVTTRTFGATWIYGAHAGARYFVGPRVAVFAEASYFQAEAAPGAYVDVTSGPGDVHAGMSVRF